MEEQVTEQWIERLFSHAEETTGLVDIREYLDNRLFHHLKNSFIAATGLNGNIIDRMGNQFSEYLPHRSPKFCRLVQSSPEGKRRCQLSDARAVEFSMRQGKMIVRSCHAGLQDCAAPIRFKDLEVGAFITGQVLLEPLTDEKAEKIAAQVSDLGLDEEELFDAIREIPHISEEKLKATTEFMQILVDYIVKTLEEADSKRREAEWRSQLRETEMKAIQSKLHPHFLFNIINLISGQALLENAHETYQTINQLSKLLRYLVKTSRPMVTLKEELDNLNAYLFLQALRYEDRFSFEVQLQDESLKMMKLPCLTLQLLVENAIIHGIEPKEGRCKLILRIQSSEHRVIIEIEDDGTGIGEDKLDQLCNGYGETAQRLSGIHMIRKRLDYYFGGDFEFHIRSVLGSGTVVTIEIPLQQN